MERPSPAPAVVDPKRQYLLGTVLLLFVVTLWVLSSFIMNSMFTSLDYNKPFLITYLCTSTFVFYLVRPAYQRLCRERPLVKSTYHGPAMKSTDSLNGGYEPVGSYLDANGVLVVRPDFAFRARSHSRSMSRSRSRPLSVICTDPPLTTKQTAALALAFCGLWFGANWAMNASLGYTSVSSTTILSSMSGFFTLGIGACAGVEKFTPSKLASVVLSIIGVIIVSKGDHDIGGGPGSNSPKGPGSPTLPSAPLLGDALALASALAYAFYVILLKVRIRNESRVSMTLFFGFVGLFNIIGFWPLGIALHFTGVETWKWPHGGALWAGIAINAAITFVSDALYLRAMLMTSPLAVTLGMSLTIPFAMAGDVYRGTEFGGWKVYIGGALVLISFIGNGLMDLRTASEEMDDVVVSREQSILEERIGSRRTSYDEPRESERQGLLPVMENRIEENNSRGEAG